MLSDLAVGLGIFFALGCGMIWLMDTVRFADSSALLDLEGLFEDLRHNPADQIWVLIMLGSTLLPTLLHAALGLTTAVLSHPEKLQKLISYLLHQGGKGYAPLGRLGQLLLSVVCASVLTLMGLMVYLIVQFDHGWLLKHLIDFFEGFAQIIGAVSIAA
ncbi:hypothetical protein [Epibacterium ulvae]|uniref:hypothetical protein n=1 Tax=Epibacterium ulvae TaxID=1156985 RepID=UPI0024922C08|nr:hypothetical protein [Epibacterium ulvae]